MGELSTDRGVVRIEKRWLGTQNRQIKIDKQGAVLCQIQAEFGTLWFALAKFIAWAAASVWDYIYPTSIRTRCCALATSLSWAPGT